MVTGTTYPWEKRDTSPISDPNRVKGIVRVPAERGEERVEEFEAELFFFVVAGKKDLATKVEAVNQTFDAVGCGRTHAARG